MIRSKRIIANDELTLLLFGSIATPISNSIVKGVECEKKNIVCRVVYSPENLL
jgi:hypothetical protein